MKQKRSFSSPTLQTLARQSPSMVSLFALEAQDEDAPKGPKIFGLSTDRYETLRAEQEASGVVGNWGPDLTRRRISGSTGLVMEIYNDTQTVEPPEELFDRLADMRHQNSDSKDGADIEDPASGQVSELVSDMLSRPTSDQDQRLTSQGSVSEPILAGNSEKTTQRPTLSRSGGKLRDGSKKEKVKTFTRVAGVESQSCSRPSLRECQSERTFPQPLTLNFYGEKFFRDDCFPDWLVKRKDFLQLCPRFCADEKEFNNIQYKMPLEFQVHRALKFKFDDDMDDQTIKAIARNSKPHEVPADTMIYREGDVSDGMYVLIKGKVGISSQESNGAVTKVKEVCIFGRAEISGSCNFAKRGFTVVTSTPCYFAKLDYADYKNHLGIVKRESIVKVMEWCDEGRSWLISQLTKRRQMLLADVVRSQLYPENGEVYLEGDPATVMFIVRRGKCIARKQLDLKQANHKFTNDITLAEFNVGDYFGEEICVGRETRLMRVVADEGGVELFVLEKKLINEIFPEKLWDLIRSNWKEVLQNIEENYNSNLTLIRGKKAFYDFKLKAIGPRFDKRMGYSRTYVDNVDSLQRKELVRSSSLTSLYNSKMGFKSNDLTRSVKYTKTVEERLWKASYIQKQKEAKLMKNVESENDKRVAYARNRPPSKELQDNAQEFTYAIDGVNSAMRVRERAENDYRRRNVPRLIDEQNAKRTELDKMEVNEDEENTEPKQ